MLQHSHRCFTLFACRHKGQKEILLKHSVSVEYLQSEPPGESLIQVIRSNFCERMQLPTAGSSK